MVLGLILFDAAQETKDAKAKADQFIAALEAAGAPAPATRPGRARPRRATGERRATTRTTR